MTTNGTTVQEDRTMQAIQKLAGTMEKQQVAMLRALIQIEGIPYMLEQVRNELRSVTNALDVIARRIAGEKEDGQE